MSRSHTIGVEESSASHVSGWISFAAFMLITLGIFHLIAGLVALFQPDQYLVTANQLLIFDYSVWGWTHMIFGAVLLAASGALLAGKTWARALTITLAILSAIANFGFIWAYPLWSLTMIALDVMIIYGIATHNVQRDAYDD